MKPRTRQSPAPSPAPEQMATYPAWSFVAVYYAPILRRLLDLSREFDQLVNPKGIRASVKRMRQLVNMLRAEEERLKVADANVKMILQIRGGQREVIRDAIARRCVSSDERQLLDFYRRRASEQLAVVALNRFAAYGTELPVAVTPEEVLAIENHFHGHDNARQLGQAEVIDKRPPRSPSRSTVPDLIEVLSQPEPDVPAIQRVLETVMDEILDRTMQRLEECDRPMKKSDQRYVQRVRSMLVLEIHRGKFARQCCRGILRCLGGGQRLSIETEQHRRYQAHVTDDPKMQQIIDRICDDVGQNRAREIRPSTHSA